MSTAMDVLHYEPPVVEPIERAPRQDPFGLVGRTVGGKYRVEAVVEETGLSVVYRASHRVWRRPVAIKAFKAQSAGDETRQQLLESFVREGAFLAELSERTAAVCQARDVASLVTERGEWVPYMVLEWLDGESLDVLLQRERTEGTPPRTVERALHLLEPVARALALAHDRGIVHRDVKPGNICVLADASATGMTPTKLYDFGIATSFRGTGASAGEHATQLCSFTPGYAAPEQYSPEHGPIGPWTDVFALALVFLELVTGREPLPGVTLDELRARACDPVARPTPRTHRIHVGESVEKVLGRALALRPQDRFAHAGDFWTALTQAARERLREATMPIMLTRPRRPASGRWLLPALGIGGGAATFAVLSHWALLSQVVLGFVH
jgi:eukaryotic-like serine/threonine-protein kinase